MFQTYHSNNVQAQVIFNWQAFPFFFFFITRVISNASRSPDIEKKEVVIFIVIGIFRFPNDLQIPTQLVEGYSFQNRLSRVRARTRLVPQMLISQLLLFTTTVKPFRAFGTQFGNGEILTTPDESIVGRGLGGARKTARFKRGDRCQKRREKKKKLRS